MKAVLIQPDDQVVRGFFDTDGTLIDMPKTEILNYFEVGEFIRTDLIWTGDKYGHRSRFPVQGILCKVLGMRWERAINDTEGRILTYQVQPQDSYRRKWLEGATFFVRHPDARARR